MGLGMPGFTKLGRGELDIAGPATFSGALSLGVSDAQDGGTLRFTGPTARW